MFAELILQDLRPIRSSRRNKQEGMLALEKMAEIGSMASSISHDMRHWLSIVCANIEFLQSTNLPSAAKHDVLVDMQEAVALMTGLTDSLLQFARTGRTLPPSRTTISDIIASAIHAVKKHPDVRGVCIATGASATIEVVGDVARLERAIYNLILNACQAAVNSRYQPNVHIDQLEEGGLIFVKIVDNGPGIPASIRDTLFEPFVTEHKHNGTGLGLALALDTAKAHGGSIYVEESERGRTVFTLALPAQRRFALGLH